MFSCRDDADRANHVGHRHVHSTNNNNLPDRLAIVCDSLQKGNSPESMGKNKRRRLEWHVARARGLVMRFKHCGVYSTRAASKCMFLKICTCVFARNVGGLREL